MKTENLTEVPVPSPEERVVVEIITRWLLAQTTANMSPRVNYRLVFGDERIAELTRAALKNDEGSRADGLPRRHFFVRTSADSDAVRLRHGRPADVPPNASVVYALFWTPSLRGHELNAQSLADLQSFDVIDVLAYAGQLGLAADEAIIAQCNEAATSWATTQVSRARDHLLTAWSALRACLCQRKGGRERSIPFASRLDVYARFLLDARVPDEEWSTCPKEQRAARLVARWGAALPALSMFAIPELASVLGVRTNVSEAVGTPKRNGEPGWVDALAAILGENIEHAVDFASLHDAIAGKRTLEEQLNDLCPRVSLCRDPERRDVARKSLEAFCHNGDEDALRQVEWLFFERPESKRSTSQGLKGLLMARGRRTPRANPLDVLASETLLRFATLVPEQRELVEQYVTAQRTAVVSASGASATVVDVLEQLADGTAPPVTIDADLGPFFEAMAQSPLRQGEELRALAARWRTAIGTPGADDRPVTAPTVLLGVARLCAQRALGAAPEHGAHRIEGATAGDRLVLRLVQDAADAECKVFETISTKWDDATLERLRAWLTLDVRRALFERDEAEVDRDEDGMAEFEIDVARKPPTGGPQPLGRVRIQSSSRAASLWASSHSSVPQSWSLAPRPGEPHVSDSDLTSTLRDLARAKPKPEATAPEGLIGAWNEYASESRNRGDAEMALSAPVSRHARIWSEQWADAIGRADSAASTQAVSKRREDLQARLTNAIKANNWALVTSLNEEQEALPTTQSEAAAPKLEDVRSLLRAAVLIVNASSGRVDRIALTPHHPLVVRLRAVAERLLGQLLTRLWSDGWPANDRARDELNDQLDDFGLPEPLHAYGFWDGEPLAFEGWIEGPVALFTRLGRDREIDAASLGVREVAEVVERYRRLYPAAGDRLALRLNGDERCHWAWDVLDRRLSSPKRAFSADVEVVTTLDPRERTRIDTEVVQHGEYADVFEPGPEGTLPAVRVRRVRPGDEGELPHHPLHLSMLVGERVDAFRPHWDKAPPDPAPEEDSMWSTRVLFDEPRPVLSGYSFRIGDPSDGLCRKVALAVGFASGAPGMVFHERYSFDGTRCEAPLLEHQGDAHWLVIASRQPVYRAVQQVGRRLATLLDFYTLTERGRPVHVCVSLNARRAHDDLARLQSSLATLLRNDVPPDGARGVLNAALHVAPGLAMRCAGAAVATELEGLLGLLLSAGELALAHPDAVVLSLDQHVGLLGGRGARGDLLLVRGVDSRVSVTVCEAKFSVLPAAADSPVLATARGQVTTTVERLRHLSLDHPLQARARNALARAIGHQAHLAAMSAERAAAVESLLDDLRDAHVPVVIESAREGEIHVWSISSSTADAIVLEGQTPAHIHGRATTVQRLGALGRGA